MQGAISINLSSAPFQRTRPVLVASSALGVLLVLLLGMLVWMAWLARAEAAETRAALELAQAQLRTQASEQAKLEAVLRQPENAEVLDRSLFLNGLLLRKGISWSRIFSDLEEVLPYNVRLVSVRPQVNSSNEIQLQMMVGAQAGEPVIEMLQRLEASPLFGATSVSSWLPPSQSEPLYRYRVTVNYAPKL